MADSFDPKLDDESSEPKRRFGSGRSIEDVLNEVYRHTSCFMRDMERIQSYLEAVSRKRDNTSPVRAAARPDLLTRRDHAQQRQAAIDNDVLADDHRRLGAAEPGDDIGDVLGADGAPDWRRAAEGVAVSGG